MKAPILGLVGISTTQGGEGLVHSVSVNVPWLLLQPTQGQALVRPNPIDAAISEVSRLSPYACEGVLVRVLAGVDAPTWAKRLGGPPIPVQLSFDNASGSIGRFWTRAYSAAYADLQRELAAAYDNQPLVREVAVSQCTTFYAEPMIRQIDEVATVQALRAAGYNSSVDLACQHEELTADEVWRRTNVLLSLNPYERIAADGEVSRDSSIALRIAADCRSIFGSRCVLGNNSVQSPSLGGAYPALYEGMHRLGEPLALQLAAPERDGDVVSALRWCKAFGAASVEAAPMTFAQLARQDPKLLLSLNSPASGG